MWWWLLTRIARRWVFPTLKRIAEAELPPPCVQCIDDLLDIAIKWGLKR